MSINRRCTAAVAVMMFLASACEAGTPARFEPPAGKRLLIIGQDMGAIGGFAAPDNDGYVDRLGIVPGGVTTYLSLPGLRGLEEKVNLGAGDLCAQCIRDNPLYANSALAIGLYFVDQEKKVADGDLDPALKRLAQWIKAANRPVFLRAGYEFDGSWNHYDPSNYKKAFQHIVALFREEHVTNCAFVWQGSASPYNGNHKDIAEWYPGDDYVDWVGYSWFLSGKKQVELTDILVNFARQHQKPVMVCESAPQGYDIERLTSWKVSVKMLDAITGSGKKPVTPDQIWNDWYVPYFQYLDKNQDAIKAVAYINVNWDAELMWGFPYSQGYWGDSRVEANPYIRQKWLETISQKSWLQASPSLFHDLGM